MPANVAPVHLPPCSPRLNLLGLDPRIERVWLDRREHRLSLRVFADQRALVAACGAAWTRLAAEPGRLRSLCDQPWIKKVTS